MSHRNLSIASQADEHGTKAIHPPSLPEETSPNHLGPGDLRPPSPREKVSRLYLCAKLESTGIFPVLGAPSKYLISLCLTFSYYGIGPAVIYSPLLRLLRIFAVPSGPHLVNSSPCSPGFTQSGWSPGRQPSRPATPTASSAPSNGARTGCAALSLPMRNPQPPAKTRSPGLSRLIAANQEIVSHSDAFFGYATTHRLPPRNRHPQPLSPPTSDPRPSSRTPTSNCAPPRANFLPHPSSASPRPIATPYPENDVVNARWYPAPPEDARPASRNRP